MKHPGLLLSLLPCLWSTLPDFARADDVAPIVPAVNGVGLDLYRAQAATSDANLLLSPYSIETALAMAYAGADGDTKSEMQRVLHLPAADEAVANGFAAFARQLAAMTEESKKRVARAKKEGGPSTPTEVTVANRLFVQAAYELRKPFISLLADRFGAPLEQLDFRQSPEKSRAAINQWVETQTRQKIRDLIPQGGVTKGTRAVLANAIYLHAPWADEFSDKATEPERFRVHGKDAVDVPTMVQTTQYGYTKQGGFTAIDLPYSGGELSFLILLPDAPDGLAKLEQRITPDLLAKETKTPGRKIELHLPKFRIEPPTVPLADVLQQLGMKTAFDQPPGSANFDRMAPRKPGDYLYISQVFHKAYLALDEKGTEAAAATAVSMELAAAIDKAPPPPVVRVDHPFLFAIQHRPSGVCLFLGRVTDPR